MKLWIARDNYGALTLHIVKPKWCNEDGIEYWSGSCYLLPLNQFPEVTFENSPQEVELKLASNENN